MKVLVVEPLKPCYVREIEGLKAMQDVYKRQVYGKTETLPRTGY